MNPYMKLAGVGRATNPYARLAGLGAVIDPYPHVKVPYSPAFDGLAEAEAAARQVFGAFEALANKAAQTQFRAEASALDAGIAAVNELVSGLESATAALADHAERWSLTAPAIKDLREKLATALQQANALSDDYTRQAEQAARNAQAAANAGRAADAQAWIREGERVTQQARQANAMAQQLIDASRQYGDTLLKVLNAHERGWPHARAAADQVKHATNRFETAMYQIESAQKDAALKAAFTVADQQQSALKRAVDMLQQDRNGFGDFMGNLGQGLGIGVVILAIAAGLSFQRKK